MIDSRCGLHCIGCEYKDTCSCGGYIETNGHQFHRGPVALCCRDKGIYSTLREMPRHTLSASDAVFLLF